MRKRRDAFQDLPMRMDPQFSHIRLNIKGGSRAKFDSAALVEVLKGDCSRLHIKAHCAVK